MPAGSAITFNVTNPGQAPHTFGVVVGGQISSRRRRIDAGGSATLEVPALRRAPTTRCAPCRDTISWAWSARSSRPTAPRSGDGTLAAGASPTSHATMTAEEMAAGHEQGVKDFLAGKETDTYGQPAARADDGRRREGLRPDGRGDPVGGRQGEFVDAMAFNGQVPGPEIRVNRATASGSWSRTR